MKKYLALISVSILIILFMRLDYIYGGWVNDTTTNENSSTTVNKKSSAQLPDTVNFIKVSSVEAGKVKINWEPPQATGVMALIYRDTSVIVSAEKLTSQNFVTQVNSEVAEYIDTVKQDGTYYYAVITAKDNVTNKSLLEDQNYSSIPIKVEVPKIPEIVSNIQVTLSEDKKGAIIKWKGNDYVDEYDVYKSTEVIADVETLNGAELIGAVEKGAEEYKDTSITNDGEYYFAVTTANDVGENHNLVPDENYTTKPLVYKKEVEKEESKEVETVKVEPKPEPQLKPKPEPKPVPKTSPKKIVKKKSVVRKKRINYYAKVQTIIGKDYYGENYEKCLMELMKIIYSDADGKSKNIARLFLAKTYYKLGKYNKALVIFAKLQDVYPDESKFWINLIANKSR